jgi:hypothetical protein
MYLNFFSRDFFLALTLKEVFIFPTIHGKELD